MAKTPLTGGCACEGVRYRIDADARSATTCHSRLDTSIETVGRDRNVGVGED